MKKERPQYIDAIVWTLRQLTRPSSGQGDPGGFGGYGVAEVYYDTEAGCNALTGTIPLEYTDQREEVTRLGIALVAAYRKRVRRPSHLPTE